MKLVPTSSSNGAASGAEAEWSAATEYERRVEPFTSSFVEEMISPFTASMTVNSHNGQKKKKKLLDVGCGSGLGSSIAHQAGFDVSACDVSPAMINRAKERFPSLFLSDDNKIVCADGQDLPFHNEFDYAYGAFSVIFFPDPQLGLRKIKDALVDGGEVVISAWGNYEETPAFQVFPDAVKAMDSIPDEAYVKPERIIGSKDFLSQLLKDSGFEDIYVKGPIQRYVEIRSPEEFFNRFALTSPNTMKLLDNLTEKQKEDLKAKVMELASERTRKDDGSISIPSSCYFAYGKKPTTAN